MITCTQCDELFPDLLDGDCSTSLHAQLQRQIARREACRECFAVYSRTVSLCHSTRARPAADFETRLLASLRERLPRSSRSI